MGVLDTSHEHREEIQNKYTIKPSGSEEYIVRTAAHDEDGNYIGGGGSTIVSGTKTLTTAGTAVRITATATPCKGVWVCADFLQGATITIGDSAVVGNASGIKGITLFPGSPPIFLAINDLSLLYIDSDTNGAKLAYNYITA